MQGIVIRRALCPAKLHRHVPSSLSRSLCCRGGGDTRCGAAPGKRARAVVVRARGGPKVGDGDQAPPLPDAVGASPPPGGGPKRGSVAGAVALIVGTSIGSGILAVPQSTAPAGFVPSAVCMVVCWAFLVAEALLIAEINVHLRRKSKKDGGDGAGLEVISMKSMAQATLGEWGGNLAATAYLFLSYTSMVAYTSKSGEVLSRAIGVPEPVSGAAFTAALALLIAAGGTGVTAQVNQVLTFFMIGLLLTIEVSAVAFGGGLSLPANAHWEQVPATLPVIIFTLVYHDIAPVICAYLEGDLARIRLSILVGSLVPLVSLLVWDDVALTLSASSTDPNGFGILDMLETEWSYVVVETFSLLAVGTSLIGTLLAASQFFIEQMTNLTTSLADGNAKVDEGASEGEGSSQLGWPTFLENNKISYVATGVVVVPTMLIAAAVPDSFSIATDIAGGYCMTILYGVLPPLMAWSIGSKLSDKKAGFGQVEVSRAGKERVGFTGAKPVLVGMGVFSVLMVFQQILQDLVSFNAYLLSWAS
ncbi:tyrosine-specific transport protein-like [Hordeum vulgare]|nr:tyrosine-specific transport protein-like [Hordeum vulgare]